MRNIPIPEISSQSGKPPPSNSQFYCSASVLRFRRYSYCCCNVVPMHTISFYRLYMILGEFSSHNSKPLLYATEMAPVSSRLGVRETTGRKSTGADVYIKRLMKM
jgi:hypothetical protein